MRMPRPELIQQFLARFPNHREAIGQRVTGLVVVNELVESPALYRMFGPRDQQCEIAQRISQAGKQMTRTSSSAMRSCTRGRRPMRETWSIFTQRPSDNSNMRPA